MNEDDIANRSLFRPLLDRIRQWDGWGPLFRSPDFWVMVGLNLGTLALAWVYGVSAWQVLLAWWVDSVALGVFNIGRLLSLPMGGPPPGSNAKAPTVFATAMTRLFLTGFFILHYGGFQAIYFSFLNGSVRNWFNARGPIDWPILILMVAALALHRTVRFIRDRRKPPMLELPPGMPFALAMFSPYARVVPMHAVLLSGGVFAIAGNHHLLGIGVFVFFFIIRLASGMTGLILAQMMSSMEQARKGPAKGFTGEGPWTLVIGRGKKYTRRPYPDFNEARLAADAAESMEEDPPVTVALHDRRGREVYRDLRKGPTRGAGKGN